MPRLALVVDAPGDSIPTEPGYHKKWSGLELFKGGGGHGPLIDVDFTDAAGHSHTNYSGLMNPARSSWMGARILQLDNRDWTRDSRFAAHVLKLEDWVFSSGITAHPWHKHNTPFHTNAADEWIEFVAPATPADLVSVNFAAMASALSVDWSGLNMQVVCATKGAIDGRVSPFFQWSMYPPPEDRSIWGFGNFAIYRDANRSTLLRSRDQYQTWEVIFGFSNSRVSTLKEALWNAVADFWDETFFRDASALIAPVGWVDLYLYFSPLSRADPWSLYVPTGPTDQARGGPSQIQAGPWWHAVPGNQKVAFQAQTVAYDFGHAVPRGTAGPAPGQFTLDEEGEWFNLGQDYTPLTGGGHDQKPQLYVDALFQQKAGETVSSIALTSGKDFKDTDSGQELRVQVVDEQGQVWSSDGTHFRGALDVQITPCTLTDPIGPGMAATVKDCWAPQVREIQLKFPVRLDNRVAGNHLLDDTYFKPDWTATASLHEPGSKSVHLTLTQKGVQWFRDHLYDRAHDYSCLLVEESNVNPGVYTDDSGNYLHPRVRFWIAEPPEAQELGFHPEELAGPPAPPSAFPPPLGGSNIDNPSPGWIYRPTLDEALHGRGMLARADRAWEYRAHLVDPLNQGKLFHGDAMAEGLRQVGIDPANAASVYIQPDSAPEEIQALPGHATVMLGESGTQENWGFAPDWDEHVLKWLERIAFTWRKWLFYEDMDGLMQYHQDAMDIILDFGVIPLTQATFYRTRAEALAAGQDPRQKIHTMSSIQYRPVRSNKIRILPPVATLPQVVCEDMRSTGKTLADGSPGRDTTYENFVGMVVRPFIMHPRTAASISVLQRFALVALLRLRRKIKTRTWTCNMPPWQIGIQPSPAGILLNSVVAVQGDDVYQVVKLSVQQGARNVYRTTITGEALPTPPNLGV